MQAELHAALPMYDWPEVSASWDAFWTATRAALDDAGTLAEPALRRDADIHAGWRDPELLLGQTCGWPYVSSLRGTVEPVARFDFGFDGRAPGAYHSVFIMRPEAALAVGSSAELAPLFGNAVIAINSTDSQSGFRVLGECLQQPVSVPADRVLVTGGHRNSVRAVAQGRAALAAIDAVSWRLAQAHEPAAREVVVVARSRDAPGLPLIMAKGLAGSREPLVAALRTGREAMPQADREALGIKGIVPANDADYEVLKVLPYGNFRVG